MSCGRSPEASLSSLLPRRCWTSLSERLPIRSYRTYISESDAADLVRWVADSATLVVDPDADPPVRSRDPDDGYLIALASAHRAALVSGDKDLLAIEGEIPVFWARLPRSARRRLTYATDVHPMTGVWRRRQPVSM